MKILVADKFPDAGAAELESLGAQLHRDPDLSEASLTAALKEQAPEVLIVRGTKVQAEQLDAAQSLKLIIRAGAGTNTIDVDGATARGVRVANCPGKNSIAVAELAFAHILGLDRHLVDGAADLRQGQWNKKKYSKSRGIAGQRLGLIGLGRIGQEMVKRAKAFDMPVVAWSRSLTDADALAMGVERAESPKDCAAKCDVLSVHVAMTPDTRNLIDAEVFAALPEGATFINTARGEVVDHAALKSAVEKRGLRAGLDVFEGEPTSGTGELAPGLFALPGVQGSHHIGASTEQAQTAVADETVRIVKAFKEGGEVLNCVNPA